MINVQIIAVGIRVIQNSKKPANISFKRLKQNRILEIDFFYQIQFLKNFFYFYLFIYLFYLYIYLPDSQESDGGAIHRVGNYPDLLPEMPRYCWLNQTSKKQQIFIEYFAGKTTLDLH